MIKVKHPSLNAMAKVEDFFKETNFDELQINEVKNILVKCIEDEEFNSHSFDAIVDQELEKISTETTKLFND